MTVAPEAAPDWRNQAKSGAARTERSLSFKYLFMRDEERGSRVPSYMDYSIPDAEVLDGAKCHIGIAWLFEPMNEGESRGAGKRYRDLRQAAAAGICNGLDGERPCAGREKCLIFALENGLTGVWGGEILTPNSYRADRGGDAHELLALLRGVDEDPGDEGVEPGGEPGDVRAGAGVEEHQPVPAQLPAVREGGDSE